MAVYVTLYRYTDEGIKGIRSAAEIAEGWQAEAQKRGIAVQALYWLQGQYDAVTIIESDDADAVNGLLLSIGAQGSLRTETLSALSVADIQRLTGSL